MKKKITLLACLCFTGFIIALVPQVKRNLAGTKSLQKTILTVTSESYTVPVYSANATQCQPGQDLGNAIDGLLTTMYHSNWNGNTLPDTLNFEFVDVARIDSMIYYPRTSGGSNGNFGQTEIWYSTTANPQAFVKLMNKDFGQSSAMSKVALNGADGILNPATIRVVVKSGYGNFASCAEMVFKTTVKPQVVEVCDPSTEIQMDTKQSVASGSASNYQPGTSGEGPINYSFDGDYSTIYHSNWSGGGFPITLNYNFSNVDRIDYLIYYPRSSGDNGLFQSTEIWYSTVNNPTTFTKVCDYNFNAATSSTKVIFPSALSNPATVRIIVKSGKNNFASCAEMEFYKASGSINTPPAGIFADAICSSLKAGISQQDIDGIPAGFYKSMAQCMFNGTYETKSRTQEYEPYPTVGSMTRVLKTSGFSNNENPTGIYFEAGTPVVVFVEDTHGQDISMKVADYSSHTEATYKLESGINKLLITSKGLSYINYYTDNYVSLQPVRIHICGGKVNGYYELNKTTAQEWRSMLTHAATNMIDLKGNKIYMLYPVAGLKQYSPNDGKELVQFYDSVVSIQYKQMGLYKYNRIPKNHMYAEATNEDGSWHAGGGAHYGGALDITCSVEAAKQSCWGIAHELGHVNEMSPGLKWVSTTEVMNNVYSVWTTYLFTDEPNKRKLEVETINDGYYNGYETGTGFGKGNEMVGGRFNAFLNNGVLKGQQWLCQYGPDAMRSSGSEPDWEHGNGDHFVKLCALWQLELYYQVAHPEKADWYGDVAEKVRNTNESSLSQGQLMVNFMKNTCDVVQEDLTDYFRKVGMLRTFDKFMNDYGSAQLTITAADSANLVAYIASKGYPKPESPVLYYLSANSVNAFKNHLDVTGTPNSGCTATLTGSEYQKYITVDHAIWKNVVAFETYKGTKLARISMVGSGYANNNKTRVYYPTGSTAIYAVAWDGTRKLVYGVASATPAIKKDSSVKIQPNPSKESFEVTGIQGTATLTLTDLCGHQVLIKKINNKERVDISSLTNEVYIVKITTQDGLFSQKLIKK